MPTTTSKAKSPNTETPVVWAMRTLGYIYVFPASHKPSKPIMKRYSWMSSSPRFKALTPEDNRARLFSFCQELGAKFFPKLKIDTPTKVNVTIAISKP